MTLRATFMYCFIILNLIGCGDTTQTGMGSGANEVNPNLNDVMIVSENISSDTTWSADKTYVLDTLVFVTDDATLTIEAGTNVLGNPNSALISTRGSKLITNGTPEAPVVFTSASAEGERAPGDWGGVVMLGSAPINVGENRIEGIESTNDLGLYGGMDDASDCGSLKYTRIEFAGFELSADNELNGLTLGGCGSATTISYVQVHLGKDDGVEFFGGSAQADHLVITSIQDDSIDWDEGFSGAISHLIVQQNPIDADNGIEADSLSDNHDATPRSNPTITQATLIGTNDSAGTQRGMVLRRGTHTTLSKALVLGFPVVGVDVRDAAGSGISITDSLFYMNGPTGAEHFDADSDEDGDDDSGFNELDFASAQGNIVDVDPMLIDAFNVIEPNFMAGEAVSIDGGYIGALDPNGDDWTQGWTAYPAY